MIVDACLFSGEAQMLELRFRTLAPVVDRFVVVASTLTHQGDRADQTAINAAYLEAITACSASGPAVTARTELHWVRPSPLLRRGNVTVVRPDGERGPAGSPWFQHIERPQRDGVADAVREALGDDAPDLTVVAVSDVDEIPAPSTLAETAVHLMTERHAERFVLAQRFHSGALNVLHPQQPWYGTCVSRLDRLRPQQHRDDRTTIGTPDQNVTVVYRGGWHLSYFGTDAERQRKLETFSHAEILRDGRWDPVEGRRMLTHANGEQCRRVTSDEYVALDWPAPLTDGSFVPPDCWWAPTEGDQT